MSNRGALEHHELSQTRQIILSKFTYTKSIYLCSVFILKNEVFRGKKKYSYFLLRREHCIAPSSWMFPAWRTCPLRSKFSYTSLRHEDNWAGTFLPCSLSPTHHFLKEKIIPDSLSMQGQTSYVYNIVSFPVNSNFKNKISNMDWGPLSRAEFGW